MEGFLWPWCGVWPSLANEETCSERWGDLLGVTQPAVARAWDRKGKPMMSKGLSGRKEVGVIVKAGGWPLFLIPVQPGCQFPGPKGNPGRGSPGRGIVARITPILLQQTEL